MSRRRQLLWKVFPISVLVTVLAIVAVGGYSAVSLRRFLYDDTEERLSADARLLAKLAAPLVVKGDRLELERLCSEEAVKGQVHVTVVLPGGEVIADSARPPSELPNQADQPEIQMALEDGTGQSIRRSEAKPVRQVMYVAVAARLDDRTVAVVRTSSAVTSLVKAFEGLVAQVAFAVLVVAAVATLLSYLVARRVVRPLEVMQDGAERFANGDLDHRLQVRGAEELSVLAEALNRMAGQLDERIRTITRQRGELEAILAAMTEAVVVVDSSGYVVRANLEAERVFGRGSLLPTGRPAAELARTPSLLHFLEEALSAVEPREVEVVLETLPRLHLLVRSAPIPGENAGRVATLFVFTDISRIRQLEKVRSDFVANVSHELRTPITSIKGFVETLRDGALNDPEAAAGFLEIVARQSDRLSNIIDDLLALSRLELSEERRDVPMEPVVLADLLQAAVVTCSKTAEGRQIRVETSCEPGLTVTANAPLLEQAVVNLLDNAIKYSGEGSTVELRAAMVDERPDRLGSRPPGAVGGCTAAQTGVSADRLLPHRMAGGTVAGREVEIRVTDHGCGIASEHLPRIFERFYRVDKGRSRAQGGTGLGLAIVKHIVNLHSGTVSVESEPDRGSSFAVRLKAAVGSGQ
jgi:two-component system phosphate regulon sensor histidine kinase PhoR